MTTLLVNLGGLVLMAAIVWWFWLPAKPTGARPDSPQSRTGSPQSQTDAHH